MVADPLRSPAPDPWAVEEAAFPDDPAHEGRRLVFLLRYAILAPSTHNSQPWEFEVGEDRVDVFVDRARWLRIADADQRELHLSVGCALENLLVAAEHYGLAHEVEYFPRGGSDGLAARVRLEESVTGAPVRAARLFHAMTERRTNRGAYDGTPVAADRLRTIGSAVREEGVGVHFLRDPSLLRRFRELVIRADAVHLSAPERCDELSGWLGKEAFRTRWFLSRVARLARAHLLETGYGAPRDESPLQGAPVLGVLTLDRVDRTRQLQAGQAFERLFLTATAEGLALQPMCQALQVPGTRHDLRATLPRDWGEPQIVFRIGHDGSPPHAPRRPLEHVVA